MTLKKINYIVSIFISFILVFTSLSITGNANNQTNQISDHTLSMIKDIQDHFNPQNPPVSDEDNLRKILEEDGVIQLIINPLPHEPALPLDAILNDIKDQKIDYQAILDNQDTNIPFYYEDEQNRALNKLKLQNYEYSLSKLSPHIFVEIKDKDVLENILKNSPNYSVQLNQLDNFELVSANGVMDTDSTWSTGPAGSGENSMVAILDSGVQMDHEFFDNKKKVESCFSINNSVASSLCPNGNTSQNGVGSATPCTGISGCDHGTHVAGIAVGNNSTISSLDLGLTDSDFNGTAKDADIMGVTVFSQINVGGRSGCGTSPVPCIRSYQSDQIQGLNRVGLVKLLQILFQTDSQITTANMSLGGRTNFTSPCDAAEADRKNIIDTLRGLKVSTTISAGNNNGFGVSAPGCISTTVSVGNTTDTDTVTGNLSNFHPNIDIFAPGTSIRSSISPTGYGFKTGTSMAAPATAGGLAIMAARYPSESIDEHLKILQDTAVDFNYSNGGTTFTGQRLNFCRNYVKRGSNWECGFNWIILPEEGRLIDYRRRFDLFD